MASLLRLLERTRPIANIFGFQKLRFARRLKQNIVRRIIQSGLKGNMVLTKIDGLRMFVYPRLNYLENFVIHPYEPYTLSLFKAAATPGATVLDIGANLGLFSLIAARQTGPKGRIYAFEPGPDNFELLIRNIKLSGFTNIVPLQKAVGSECKNVTLLLAESPDLHSLYTHPLSPTRGAISIDCVSIDEFLQGQSVAVIKMDIEGNELQALRGMRKTIAANPNLVLILELNPGCLRQAGVQPGEVLDEIESLGFIARVVDEETRCLKPLSKKFVQQAAERSAWYTNLYCVKRTAALHAP